MSNQFKFIRVDRFFDDMNREDCFDTEDMDCISPNFRFVLASDCKQNIEDCLDIDGTLDLNEVTLLDTDGADDGMCSMLWSQGINGERSMSISDSTVSFDIGEDTANIKGIFLCAVNNGTGYVIAYCILDKVLEVDGVLILPCNGMVWSVHYG